ncbi:MAG: hypothetical protein WBA17_06455 [Saprospiraceae bacterium]
MRNFFLYSFTLLLCLVGAFDLQAHIDPTRSATPPHPNPTQTVNFRNNCDNAVAQVDQDINNVRARLTTGGDIWWDGNDGRYVVPKPPPGVDEVSSIFAGAVWLGGRSPGGELKVAAQDYGRSSGEFDYYPGPLTANGTTSKDTCARWDKFFEVSGQNIRQFRAQFQEALANGQTSLDPNDIPEDILGWPGSDNPYFFDIHGFDLPSSANGALAGYWEEGGNPGYDPTEGDFPIIEIRGCSEEPQFPDQMIFWIYNDAGNIHRQSNLDNQIGMEIQVQAFSFQTADDINNMSFQRFKLINRATEDIVDTYFAMWVDPDLGCYTDDYVGCDTTRDLAFVYNEDPLDGTNGCTCDQGVTTYCDEVPILGVDYFRGPLDEFDNELGMSSFIYMNNAGIGPVPPGTTDPNTADEYYRLLRGIWRDGRPLETTGDGYDEGTSDTSRYAFNGAPNDPDGWSMCTEGLGFGDRRTLQASGPFTLEPGRINELIVGVVWVGEQVYPCPSLNRLQEADDIAQDLFDNCFELPQGPDAPTVDWIELDQEIIAVFTNDDVTSNNALEAYEEPGLGIPDSVDGLYRFEGYMLYQLASPDVSLADVDDPEKVRLIAKYDLVNEITSIFDWRALSPDAGEVPGTEPVFFPVQRADGNNNGIRHTVRITEDAFGSDDTRLINHKRYYFVAIAYGYNNYQEFDPRAPELGGQRKPYIQSTQNVGDENNAYYTVIPRPIVYQNLNARYGDGAIITRIEGKGNNGNFLNINDESTDAIDASIAAGETYKGEITYDAGSGPLDVLIYDPLGVVNGEYEVTFVDVDTDDQELTDTATWVLRSLTDPNIPAIVSDRGIDQLNEQIIPEFGFSLIIGNPPVPGANPQGDNGYIGAAIEYADPAADPWLAIISPEARINSGSFALDREVFDYVDNGEMERFEELDPRQRYTQDLIPYPYKLMDWNDKESGVPFISPVWINSFNAVATRNLELSDLNSINVVFTSNKELWSRCPVIETANKFYQDLVPPLVQPDLADQFDTRDAPSVTRNAGADGLPEVDADAPAGETTGMGWFPGYAYDVETGQRLEIFFGENSTYTGETVSTGNGNIIALPGNGNDMIWNPSGTIFTPLDGIPNTIYNFVAGAQHFFYVTNQPYDGGTRLEGRLQESSQPTRKTNAIRTITWAGFPLLLPGAELRSYAEGIIPNDLTLKLRVNSQFGVAEGAGSFNGYPTYRFKIDGKMSEELAQAEIDNALNQINIVPNPYYGFSSYESNQFENIVKITNLPSQATVTIYSLDGKFIRKYDRDESPAMLRGNNRAKEARQINPDLEWDLKNYRFIPIASGVYLIHVEVPGLGSRTLKWFGVNREFDPSGL